MIRFTIALLLAAPLFASPPFSPTVPDVEVVTHEGKRVRFYSDLVKGRSVAVNFVFTNCSTICPASGALFAALQKQSGADLHFISVSIDPAYDTPARLTAWSKPFRAGASRWTLVTGSQAAVDAIVKAFGGPAGRPQDHQPLTIIGSDATKTWRRLYGFPGSDKVAEAIAGVARGEAR